MKLDTDPYATLEIDAVRTTATAMSSADFPFSSPRPRAPGEGLLTQMEKTHPDGEPPACHCYSSSPTTSKVPGSSRRRAFSPGHAPGEEPFSKMWAEISSGPSAWRCPNLRWIFTFRKGRLSWVQKPSRSSTPRALPRIDQLYWPEKKALFTGDVVFPMGVGRTDFPGGDGALLRKSIERLAQLDGEWLLSGHGEV